MINNIKMKIVNTKNQEKTIKKLLKQNQMFYKNLNIMKITYFRHVKRLEKIIFSFIVKTKFSEKINRIIIENFLKK